MTQNYDYLVFDKNPPEEVKNSLVECKINYSIIQKRAFVLTLNAPLELPELIQYNFYKIIYSQQQYALLAQKSLRHLCEAPYGEQMYYDLQDRSINKDTIEALMINLLELYSSMMIVIPHGEFPSFINRIIEVFVEVQAYREKIGFDKTFEIVVANTEEGGNIDDGLYLDDDGDNLKTDSVEVVETSSNNPFILASRNIH